MLKSQPSDKRRHPRHLTLRTAKIFCNRGVPAIDCAIVNISDGGACILLSDPGEIPNVFDLAIDNDGKMRGCRVAWRSGNRIGVAFTGGIAFD
jgi:PilZ domain